MNNGIKTHANLEVWERSIRFVRIIYELTNSFPSTEKFGLVEQMRKSAISVPSNIAEGAARFSRRDFIRFLGIARGSLMELQTQLIIASHLDMTLDIDDELEEIESIKMMINGLVRHLRGKLKS